MRLTYNLRSEFTTKVMNDVPKVKYDDVIRDYLQEECKKMLPEDLKPMFEKYPEWFPESYHPITIRKPGIWFNQAFQLQCPASTTFSKEVMDHVEELAAKEVTQRTLLNRLRSQLTNSLYVCRTDTDVRETFPEFYFYLPEGNSKPRKLNSPLKKDPNRELIAQFIAAGWRRNLVTSP